jgi:hypothetical protein
MELIEQKTQNSGCFSAISHPPAGATNASSGAAKMSFHFFVLNTLPSFCNRVITVASPFLSQGLVRSQGKSQDGKSVAFTVRPKPARDPNVSSTAEAS